MTPGSLYTTLHDAAIFTGQLSLGLRHLHDCTAPFPRHYLREASRLALGTIQTIRLWPESEVTPE